MPRHNFGKSLESWVLSTQDASVQYGAGVEVVSIEPGVTVTFWTLEAGGAQITDLLDSASNPVTQVSTDIHGVVPLLWGPNDVSVMWADAGGPRLLIKANDLAGPAGPQGAIGPTGPGEPTVYYNRTTSTYPARSSVAGTGVFKWAGPVFPTAGGIGAVEGDILRLEPN